MMILTVALDVMSWLCFPRIAVLTEDFILLLLSRVLERRGVLYMESASRAAAGGVRHDREALARTVKSLSQVYFRF
jgi:hypothetical protein